MVKELYSAAERHKASLIAAQGEQINAQAARFKRFVEKLLGDRQVTGDIVVNVSQVEKGAALDFTIDTSHAAIQAVFQHAFRDETLVGRYRFTFVSKDANGTTNTNEIWSLLLDGHGRATWSDAGEWDWSFDDNGGGFAVVTAREFLCTLLIQIQKVLPHIKVGP